MANLRKFYNLDQKEDAKPGAVYFVDYIKH